jgi:hypothetical protein
VKDGARQGKHWRGSIAPCSSCLFFNGAANSGKRAYGDSRVPQSPLRVFRFGRPTAQRIFFFFFFFWDPSLNLPSAFSAPCAFDVALVTWCGFVKNKAMQLPDVLHIGLCKSSIGRAHAHSSRNHQLFVKMQRQGTAQTNET